MDNHVTRVRSGSSLQQLWFAKLPSHLDHPCSDYTGSPRETATSNTSHVSDSDDVHGLEAL